MRPRIKKRRPRSENATTGSIVTLLAAAIEPHATFSRSKKEARATVAVIASRRPRISVNVNSFQA